MSKRLPSPPKTKRTQLSKKYYDPDFEDYWQVLNPENYKTKSKQMYRDISKLVGMLSRREILEIEYQRIEDELKAMDKKISTFKKALVKKY
ncbi:hypothetical protein EBZ38_11610 [bacterium]|nr:hypothetical protein [bacterium]